MSDGYPKPIDPPELIQRLARDVGGTINECAALPDGSGFATMSMPLPKGHWLTAEGDNDSPMPFRMGAHDYVVVAMFPNTGYPDRHLRLSKREFEAEILKAAQYACRASTMNGKETDFDPDAMTRNFINGMVGYNTVDGRSHLDDPPEKAVFVDLEQIKQNLSAVCYGLRWTEVLRLTDEIERLRALIVAADEHFGNRAHAAAAHIAQALTDPPNTEANTFAGRSAEPTARPSPPSPGAGAGAHTASGILPVTSYLHALLVRARQYVAECIELSNEVRTPTFAMRDTLHDLDVYIKEGRPHGTD